MTTAHDLNPASRGQVMALAADLGRRLGEAWDEQMTKAVAQAAREGAVIKIQIDEAMAVRLTQ